MKFSRSDGEQEADAIDVSLPPGLSASLRGTALCPDAALASATAVERTGVAELESPSCPQTSALGRVVAAVGVGSEPFYLKTGKLYLAGPYEGAPFSVAAVIPALAGPIDFGISVVRLPIQVDPRDGHLSLSGRLPTAQKGVALRIRSLALTVNKPGFISNPTSCDSASIRGVIDGIDGAVANVSSPFQMLECGTLRFKPKLSTRFTGGRKATRHAAHPGLRAQVRSRAGDSRMSRAVITLPGSEQLDPAHIRNLCKPALFDAGRCPKNSIYGFAEAVTPLLNERLAGPVYLRSSTRQDFPDVAVRLSGQVDFDLTGRIKFANGRIRLVFAPFPDVPISTFRLNMLGRKKGILINDRNLCSGPIVTKAKLAGQGGKRMTLHVPTTAAC